MKTYSIAILISLISGSAAAQSTSPSPVPLPVARNDLTLIAPATPVPTITFSEFPLGTAITTQYTDQGIVFGGDDPFISQDGANPTSPVLSGSPLFQGSIEGVFVNPDEPSVPVVIESLSLDAGFFDALRSTRIEWFDPDGEKLGQQANSIFGIENFTISGGNIAHWKIAIFEDEPAGYAIDNVSITPATTSVLFREKTDGKKDGSWAFGDDEIPGWDHVGFHIDNIVYESHPGNDVDDDPFDTENFVSEDGTESRAIPRVRSVQAFHSRKTFEHDSDMAGKANSPVIEFEEIPIPRDLAESMEQQIEMAISNGAVFQFLNFSIFGGIQETLSPAAQKGGDNSFTCIGLVEWAAEQAGHNGGQGFISNQNEAFTIGGIVIIPLLSPNLLNESLKNAAIAGAPQWFQGLFDPVDFLIIDPLGRRLGFTPALGEINEIPNAFYSGDGELEQFLIPNAIPGLYQIVLTGVGAEINGGIGSRNNNTEVVMFLATDDETILDFQVEIVPGMTGDVNGDGIIDEADVAALAEQLNTFTDGPNDPGDINGDGLLTDEDLEFLEELVSLNDQIKVEIDIRPGSDVNPIKLNGSQKRIPVAIITTADFDARDVDASTVLMEGAPAIPSGQSGKIGAFEDVDGDGDIDLLLRFFVKELELDNSSVDAMIMGSLMDGRTFSGMDTIKIVP